MASLVCIKVGIELGNKIPFFSRTKFMLEAELCNKLFKWVRLEFLESNGKFKSFLLSDAETDLGPKSIRFRSPALLFLFINTVLLMSLLRAG